MYPHHSPRSWFASLWAQTRHSKSVLLVWVCVAFFLVAGFLTAFGIVGRRELAMALGLSYAGIMERYWLFQFLTAPLLHSGVLHLLFNMLALWMLGPPIERVLGLRRYWTLSITCALCSMAGFLLLDHGRGHIVMGYSGVIFGILVAQAVYFPEQRIILYFFPVKMKHAVLILGAVTLYLCVAPEEGGSVAHSAHLFGALSAYGLLRYWRHCDHARTPSNIISMPHAFGSPPKSRPLPKATPGNIPDEL